MSYLIKTWLDGTDSNFMPLVEQVVIANELLTVVLHLTGHTIKYQRSQTFQYVDCIAFILLVSAHVRHSSPVFHPPPPPQAFYTQDLMLTDCFLTTIAATSSLVY